MTLEQICGVATRKKDPGRAPGRHKMSTYLIELLDPEETKVSDGKCPDPLTKTSVQQFATFFKFLAANNLIDQAQDYLLSQGITDVWISLQPIKEMQKMIKSAISQGVALSDDAKIIAFSPHFVDFESPGEQAE